MLRSAAFVFPVTALVGVLGVATLQYEVPIGPMIFLLGAIPVAVLVIAGRRLTAAVPDLVFGSIDTGLLVIPALWGGMTFGVAGAIAGDGDGDYVRMVGAGHRWTVPRKVHGGILGCMLFPGSTTRRFSPC